MELSPAGVKIGIFLIMSSLFSAAASASSVEACVHRLSTGQNRFNVNLPAKGLRRLAEAEFQKNKSGGEKRPGLFIDYSRNSKVKRAFLIDFESCDILKMEYVIHGGFGIRSNPTQDGDKNDDGMLDRCINRKGTRKYMTRPGLFVTSGCHHTSQTGWPHITSECHGVKLKGLSSTNRDVYRSGVVLHEHEAVDNDGSIKPVGQGCPVFPPGHLKELLDYNIMNDALVYIYAPQCE